MDQQLHYAFSPYRAGVTEATVFARYPEEGVRLLSELLEDSCIIQACRETDRLKDAEPGTAIDLPIDPNSLVQAEFDVVRSTVNGQWASDESFDALIKICEMARREEVMLWIVKPELTN